MLNILFFTLEVPPDLQQDHAFATLWCGGEGVGGVVALSAAVGPFLDPPRVRGPVEIPAGARLAGGGVVVGARGD